MSARRLEELRRGSPADATLQNLLAVVTGQLQLCARLPVYEYEADHDAHTDCAAAFHRLAVAEQEHVEELLLTLGHHLNARQARLGMATDAPPTKGTPR